MSKLYLRLGVLSLGFVLGLIMTGLSVMSLNFFPWHEIMDGLVLTGGFLLGTLGGFRLGELIEERILRRKQGHEKGGR